MNLLGVIVVGDYSLATGADRHVAFVTRTLAETDTSRGTVPTVSRLAWAWLLPADKVALAAALYEAWQRPHPVACFGGLGTGVDDHVRATVAALQAGRADVGLPERPLAERDSVLFCGNVSFFPGRPESAHPQFSRWWQTLTEPAPLAGEVCERLRWQLPESVVQRSARLRVREAHPQVMQHVAASPDGGTHLVLTAVSRGKAQAARKALQAALSAAAE